MENYYNSYPESGGSSPRSREIDFDNPPPWDDQTTATNNNYKVKLICSYGGKIHPRPHDNQLAYVGGETKILAVDRTIKFNHLAMKLSALCDSDMSFKYQLPGEDLDALISVTNDEDLDHMMNEYDRLNRASPKPARLRLFLFPVTVQSPARSFGSTEGRSDRDRFVEALNLAPIPSAGNADFLFGSEKGVAPIPVPVTMPVPVPVPIADPSVRHHEPDVGVLDERSIESDRIQKHIQDLRRLRITEDQQQLQQNMYRRQSDEYARDYYVQRPADKVATTTLPGSVPSPVPGYQISGGFTASNVSSDQQPVYMVPAPSNMYHAPISRPVTGPVSHGQGQSQGYYAYQRMPTDMYREPPVYNAMQPAQPVAAAQQPVFAQQQQISKPEGIRMVQSTAGLPDGSYGQVAYDNGVGRHVYYTAQGAMIAPQQPLQPNTHQHHPVMGVVPGTSSQDGKTIAPAKISQGSI
ncbi:uncharacterized protein [Rutidosis leptorrhynchoides]|uniref:uncharacterized protein n=1 Tax=Rutidosis leptorrhynchoides TaxID=125765 RepID=UPI003A9941D6